MKWGISISIPATYESDLWALPLPSSIERGKKWDGTEMIYVLFHFQYSPQNWQEWQRVAAIKTQIQKKMRSIEFLEYEPTSNIGKIYTISELGKYFKVFVKFPKPMYPGSKKEGYKMLCRHAKRLHYEGLLHLEQLIATSIRFNKVDPEGITQTIKRAVAAYRFAEKFRDQWRVKLDKDQLVDAHKKGAEITNQIKRDKTARKRELAKSLRYQGLTLQAIAKKLDISLSTIKRWLK